MTWPQWQEWVAYGNMEPFGEFAHWLRAAAMQCTFLLPHRKKGRRGPKIKDFMPKFFFQRGQKRQQTVKEMEAALKNIVRWSKSAGRHGRKRKGMKKQDGKGLDKRYM